VASLLSLAICRVLKLALFMTFSIGFEGRGLPFQTIHFGNKSMYVCIVHWRVVL
jgi:hypothetical protein